MLGARGYVSRSLASYIAYLCTLTVRYTILSHEEQQNIVFAYVNNPINISYNMWVFGIIWEGLWLIMHAIDVYDT